MKRKKLKKIKKPLLKKKKSSYLVLPEETRRWIMGTITIILAIIIGLGFFDLAGIAGKTIISGLTFLIGKAIFILPLILISAGLIFFITRYQKFLGPIIIAVVVLIIGISAILESITPGVKQGGWLGFIVSWPFLNFFGFLVSQIVFGAIIIMGSLIFWRFLIPRHFLTKEEKLKLEKEKAEKGKPLITRMFKKVVGEPKFKVKEISAPIAFEKEAKITKEPSLGLKTKLISSLPSKVAGEGYQPPPLEILEAEKGSPLAGDTRVNSAIIKKALQNFDISVEMSEINIGPTVTQYTLKPAEGVKLSKITGLSNDLSLALASHPIRIEAPIPGKALVGIEVPNKERCLVRLRNLISNPQFQLGSGRAALNLTFALGRDVSGSPVFADLARMPHLLVAGSTGTGKTIFLNSLILSLLYQNSPQILRLILIDPKRVEFSVYQDLPHLLCPVIFDAQKAINALKWLIGEMERRFDILSEARARDIISYNQLVVENSKFELMPYIVLIIDELADLMAAKGREMEAGVVRLAQMARAVGIHLVLATQRPSVEVITGLIKANITSRTTFQVASQVDSRTVLDMAGAEKLLGQGDLLFVSAEIVKPKRIQGAYVSEKEVKKAVNWLKSKTTLSLPSFAISLTEDVAQLPAIFAEGEAPEEDPLYEEAKRVVIEAKKASASLLQRRLRLGYARAARLIDILEERGVVGPGEGAKPREVYLSKEVKDEMDEEGWQKV